MPALSAALTILLTSVVLNDEGLLDIGVILNWETTHLIDFASAVCLWRLCDECRVILHPLSMNRRA